jgi:hypothetical protein
VPVENPALQAVQMALKTPKAMGVLTEKWRQLGHEIGFGIGIAHGYATLGTISARPSPYANPESTGTRSSQLLNVRISVPIGWKSSYLQRIEAWIILAGCRIRRCLIIK